jgi:hypothetical protein
MGFKKGLVLLLVLLFVPLCFATFNVNLITRDGLILPGDQAIVNFTITDQVTNKNCVINSGAVTFNTSTFSYNYTTILIGDTIAISCSDDLMYEYEIPYLTEPYVIRWEFLSMQNLENSFNMSVFNFSSTTLAVDRVNVSATSCEIAIEDSEYILLLEAPTIGADSVGYFNHTFSSFGSVSLDATCYFESNVPLELSETLSVSRYEPKLEPVFDHPFSSLTSSSGFRLGNYDLDLDGYDDIIVLSSSGLQVFYGPDYATSHDVTNRMRMNPETHFFVTDFDWDGYGDILVQNSTSVRLFRFQSRTGYSDELLYSGSNIQYAGAFDIDGNFLKDIIILNGTEQIWNYTIIQDADTTGEVIQGPLNLGTNKRCDQMLVFDINKDTIQDIICVDKQNANANFIRYLIRDDLSLPTQQFSEFALGYSASDIFFGDITSDGNWDLGVKSLPNFNGNNRLYFYNFEVSPSLILQTLSSNWHDSSTLGVSQFDPFSDNSNYIWYTTYNDSSVYTNVYDSELNSIVYMENNWASMGVSITNVNFSNVLFMNNTNWELDSDTKLTYYDNTLALYKNAPDDSFDLDINYNEGNIVNFTLDIDADWNYNNYQLVVRHTRSGTVFRNDYFDSRQNLKYYMTSANHQYEFDLSNFDLYTIGVALNKYNMLLTEQISFVQTPASIECLYVEYDCGLITSTFENDNTSTFVTKNIKLADVNFFTLRNFSLFDTTFEITNATLTFMNMTFENLSIVSFENTKNLTMTNSSLIDATIALRNANATLTNVTHANLTINASNAVITVYNTNVNITGTNITINAFNSIVTTFGETENITINSYVRSQISFVDQLGNFISRTYNLTSDLFNLSTTAGTIFTDFLIGRNEVINVFSLEFVEDYLYFPNNKTTYDIINATQNITFISTGLPFWDYAVNGSHQTDFRDYALLESIQNLPQANFSIGDGFNVTFAQPANYSGVNFSTLISRHTDSTFTIGFNTPFNISINYTPEERILVLPTYDTAIIQGGNAVVSLSNPGTYRLVSDIIFSAKIPTIIGVELDIVLDAVFSNYNGSINELNICVLNASLDNFQTNMTFADLTQPISFTTQGEYDYVLTCAGELLPTRVESGSFEVLDKYFLNFNQARLHDTFELRFYNNDVVEAITECPTYTLSGTGFSAAHTGGVRVADKTCGWNVTLTSTSVTFTLTPIDSAILLSDTIEFADARVFYDDATVLGSFWTSSNLRAFVISNNSIISRHLLNSSYNFYESNVVKIAYPGDVQEPHPSAFRLSLKNKKEITAVIST